jgi:hypothetical protein
MSWLDWLNVLAFVLALLGIPSSYHALRTMWSELHVLPEAAEKLARDIRNSSRSARSTSRVLLDFNEDRATIEGTLENVTYRFARLCPIEEDRKLLPLNPVGVMRGSAFSAVTFRTWGASAAILLAITFGSLVFRPAANAETTSVEIVVSWIAPLALGAVLAILTYFLFWRAHSHKLVHNAARGYLDYLKQNEIFIGVEFTQAVKAFEAANAASTTISIEPPSA